MKKQNLSSSHSKILNELSLQLLQFGLVSSNKKIQLLQHLDSTAHFHPKQFGEYHRCLLFMAAYPESITEYNLAQLGLKKLAEKINSLGSKKKNELQQSGLPCTIMYGVYSFELINWLINKSLLKIQLSPFETGAEHPREALKDTLNEMEFEIEANEYLGPLKWTQASFGTNNRTQLLRRLVQHIESTYSGGLTKDRLFEAMRVCISLACGPEVPQLPFAVKPYTHTEGLIKKFDIPAVIAKPLKKAIPLSRQQRIELITCARLSLIYLNRETDPVTLCESEGIEYFELDRGFSIALFSAANNRRLPLESYIGFMMFKNGFPVSYGGAWLFGKRSLLGINIYSAYRGGESAYLFAQLLRIYKQRFSPTYIEVEPYQFGKGNPEGIKTGAFWFYYRFGFRPVDKTLRDLAKKEHSKIEAIKGYRSPNSVLKLFTDSNMMLCFEKDFVNLEPPVISQFITQSINKEFEGNRFRYRKWALDVLKKELNIHFTKLSKAEKIGVEKLYSFICSCLSLSSMTKKHKLLLRQLILEKGKSEFKYAEYCEKFPFEDFIFPAELRQQLGLAY